MGMMRELTDAEMDALLAREVFGHLGCTDGQKPYVVPTAYVFHDNVIYGQTTEGRKIELLRKNPNVCLQVEEKRERTWESVICWGNFEELEFPELKGPNATQIVKLLTKKLGSIQDDVGIEVQFSFSASATPLMVNGKKSTLFRIVVTEKTGRRYTAEK